MSVLKVKQSFVFFFYFYKIMIKNKKYIYGAKSTIGAFCVHFWSTKMYAKCTHKVLFFLSYGAAFCLQNAQPQSCCILLTFWNILLCKNVFLHHILLAKMHFCTTKCSKMFSISKNSGWARAGTNQKVRDKNTHYIK